MFKKNVERRLLLSIITLQLSHYGLHSKIK